MNSIFIFIFVAVIVAQFYATGVQCNEYTAIGINDVNVSVSTECGGVIPIVRRVGDPLHTYIDYKFNQTFELNEYCVWNLLPADSAKTITLRFDVNITEVWDGIIVYTWEEGNVISLKIPNNGTTLTLKAQNIAIAFSSSSVNNSMGFRMLANVENGFGPTSARSYFLGKPDGVFSYPDILGQSRYNRNERVSVVLHGPTETPKPFREYNLKDVDVVQGYHSIAVYVLLPYHDLYAPYYKLIGKFSGKHEGFVENSKVVTQFPILYIFTSDYKGTGSGFTIEWKQFVGRD